MWIREVDFPAALIDAHRAGELVIFVGAGASRDGPSSLPDFRTLTAQIAAEAQAHATKHDLDRPDVFLAHLPTGMLTCISESLLTSGYRRPNRTAYIMHSPILRRLGGRCGS
jgi:hypothetical protein